MWLPALREHFAHAPNNPTLHEGCFTTPHNHRSMIRSAVTISLVEEARGGPFVFRDGLADGFRRAEELGFDAVEIFAPEPDAVSPAEVIALMRETGLKVAAVGTGAGMLRHGLTLTDPDAQRRTGARDFVRRMIEFGGTFGAPAIIGSMQGRWTPAQGRDETLNHLADALGDLAEAAAAFDLPLIYEPLNRYETNLITTLGDGVEFLKSRSLQGVTLLADLFHMNIEEADLAAALRDAAGFVGHVHFVDSNRRAAGMGHLDFAPLAQALRESGFAGYASAEALPLPDSETAARLTIESFRRYFGT